MAEDLTDRELAVLVRDVSKTFVVPEEQRHTLKERMLHPRKKVNSRTFEALKDISFGVHKGEFFGIAGRNGSGKSTLLKCIAGIYRAQGQIYRVGSISTMIELGVGFNMDLAARDNVLLNGIMLGLSPKEARRQYDEVIDFAELHDFQDLKVKNYSSGMLVRLAFSTAIQVNADVMLVDEILAVGDANFQQKCFDVFNDMRDRGKTIVFVTHDMSALVKFCHRATLLEMGEMVCIGDPQEVADNYLELNFGRTPTGDSKDPDATQRPGDGDARVLEVWVEDETGERKEAVPQESRITLRVRVLFNVQVEHPAVSVYILNDEHKAVSVLNTQIWIEKTGVFEPGEEATFSFTFDNVLAPGRYSPMINLAHRGTGLDTMDQFDSSSTFVVSAVRPTGGLVDLLVDAGVTRGAPQLPAANPVKELNA
ncbi:MAG: ABC transporter ATP-binding protein [Solirubrobacterales bacterium]|nr:ABC transporter ATP-binding protein [Solirubrobacterales bacterium]